MSFIISGAFAGVAGSLYTVHQSYVPIENTLSWTVSGDIVVITVLGGIGSLFGPIFGAGLYMYVKNIVSGMPVVGPFWHLILGLVFVIVVVGASRTASGAVSRGRARRSPTRSEVRTDEHDPRDARPGQTVRRPHRH